ncbi:hypothetical protein NG798_00470 [Ancylothrix sp. C2]|uniref:hypothetical protein n=1 Tax=Ancylothrix sp. D3o TaxID=2953691 RepID=UPI0021BADC77|nr:hypothetical protein [Ancylothrix sp. D3o]MCT7948266.1 hypothetical protein [Ancylothrix sp. D3o]
MTNENGNFTPEIKKSGDLIRSADWNAAMQEIVRLENDKLSKANQQVLDNIQGPLTIKGALKLEEGVAVNQFSDDENLTSNSDQILPTQKAVKTYIDTAIQGKETVNFQAKDLRVYGNLIVEGTTISKNTETMEGNVNLGNEDGDIITVFGRLRTAHSSGYLQVQTPLRITDNLIVDGKVGIGTTTPEATLEVNGSIRAKNIQSTNPLQHRMYPSEPIVYQDIFVAESKGAIAKLGNPTYDNTSHTERNLWNGRPMICYGNNHETDGKGAVVTIPEGYDTVWVRVLGDRWNAISAYLLDKDNTKTRDLGIWTGGYRSANCYCPDGSLSDSYSNLHQWVPIPIGTNLPQLAAGETRKLALISKPHTNSGFWLSGLAFSKNPWHHATQSAVGYHWKSNGGDEATWNSDNWNNDVLAVIKPNTNQELKVPVVPSGRDKLLYLVEHNSDWNGCIHNGITVNGKPIERFIATYDNPFARHWNSKSYQRYIAACIPADLIPATNGFTTYLSVKIDMSKQNDGNINFREIGTHDLETPWNY